MFLNNSNKYLQDVLGITTLKIAIDRVYLAVIGTNQNVTEGLNTVMTTITELITKVQQNSDLITESLQGQSEILAAIANESAEIQAKLEAAMNGDSDALQQAFDLVSSQTVKLEQLKSQNAEIQASVVSLVTADTDPSPSDEPSV